MIMCKSEHAKAIDKMIFPGIQGGPLVHVIAAKAVALKEALSGEFRTYQQQVVRNAQKLAQELSARGFQIFSGGTDNHLMLVDLTGENITGKEAEEALDRAGITVNKNAIPYDARPPAVTSGIRLGTPCVTTRGMGEPEMTEIADIISRVLRDNHNQDTMKLLGQRVKTLCTRFPIY
jgi:glycine hydroxymethyltransferase